MIRILRPLLLCFLALTSTVCGANTALSAGKLNPVLASHAIHVRNNAVNLPGAAANPSTNAILAGLTTTPKSSAFVTTTGPGYRNYSTTVTNFVSSIQVTPTAQDTTATIKVNGQPVASGSLSQPISLNFGANTIITEVTAQDGATVKDYIITVNRTPSNYANLLNIALSTGTLQPVFYPFAYNYGVTVPTVVSSIKLTPTAGDANATILVNGVQVVSGTASASLPLVVGSNTITVVVTAQDGVSTQTYTVVVTRAAANLSTNAVLSSITTTPKVTLTTATGPGYRNYTASVLNDVYMIQVTPTAQDAIATINVNGDYVNSGALSQIIYLGEGANTITITVTAPDKGTVKKYIITVNRALPAVATLSNLALSAGILNPVFSPATTSYSATVTNATASITVTPTVTESRATVTVNGQAVASHIPSADIPLAVGPNTITTVVMAPDSITTKTYIATVTRAAANLSTNAILSTITTNPAASITATTGPGYRNYVGSVANNVTSIRITPTAQDAAAKIKVNGQAINSGAMSQAIPLIVGPNAITIEVTAQDGATIKNYIVTVNRAASSNAILTSITITPQAALIASTGPGYRNYTTTVPNTVSSIEITSITQDGTGSLHIGNEALGSGQISGKIPLNVGDNVLTIIVKAQDNVTVKNYIITVTRQRSSDARLSAINLYYASPLSPEFARATTRYSASVPYATSSIQVNTIPINGGATATVNGQIVYPFGGWPTINLAVGDNLLVIVVTAEDGTTTKTYKVNVTRASAGQSTNALLDALTVSPGKELITTSTGPGYRNYLATVPNATSAVEVTAWTQDATATVKVNGQPVASAHLSSPIPVNVGDNTITVEVTAQDGATIKNYIITVTRGAPKNSALWTLTTSTGTLSPQFNPKIENYTIAVPNAISSIKVTPTALEPGTIITVNGVVVQSGSQSASLPLNPGVNNTIVIFLKAPGDSYRFGYTITVYRAAAGLSTDALLTGFTLVPALTLTRVTGPGYENYTASMPDSIYKIQLTATTHDPNAGLTFNGAGATSGQPSNILLIQPGANKVVIDVFAQDLVTTNSYIITITRVPHGMAIKYEDPPASPVVQAVTVHQSLSPNGDGKNDVLTIDGITNYPDNKLQIMSRSGQLIYQVKGYDNLNKTFDGQSNINGKLQPAGTYYYSLEYKDGNETKRKTGFIVIKY